EGGGRKNAAARYADNRLERPGSGQAPRQRARIAVELIPRDRKRFLRLWLRLRLLTRVRHRFHHKKQKAGVLAHIDNEIEPGSETVAGLGHVHHQFTAEQTVAPVRRLVGKIELGGEHTLLRRLHLDVVVTGAAGIERWQDGAEAVAALAIG